MITKTLTYTDFNNQKRTTTAHFNVSKVELTNHLDLKDELETMQRDLTNAGEDSETTTDLVLRILNLLRRIVDMSYGVRSEDGSKFRKSPELLQEFKETGAYDEFIWSFFDDPQSAMEFLVNVLPQDLRQEAEAKAAQQQLPIGEAPKKELEKDPKDMSTEELRALLESREGKSA